MLGDEGLDICLQIFDRGVDAPLDFLAGQLGEPALDLVDPGGGCWREMDVVVGASSQPCLYHRRLVCGVVVHDDVDIKAIRDPRVDLFKEIQELLCPMPFVAFADDEARSDIECCE